MRRRLTLGASIVLILSSTSPTRSLSFVTDVAAQAPSLQGSQPREQSPPNMQDMMKMHEQMIGGRGMIGISDDSIAVGAGRISRRVVPGTPVRSALHPRHSLRDRDAATPAARCPVTLCLRSRRGVAHRHRLGLSHGTSGSWIRTWRTAHRRGGTGEHHGYLHTLTRLPLDIWIPASARDGLTARAADEGVAQSERQTVPHDDPSRKSG